MTKLILVLLIAGTTLTGVYAIATTMAFFTAPVFASAEPNRHLRIGDFAPSLKRVSADWQDVHDNCAQVSAKERESCEDRLTATRKRAYPEMRALALPMEDTHSKENPAPIAPRQLTRVDLVLYRAHRQRP
jgi:hypothetical protein